MKNRGITWNISVRPTLCVILIAAAIIGYFTVQMRQEAEVVREAAIAPTHAHVEELAQKIARRIDGHFEAALSTVATLAQTFAVKRSRKAKWKWRPRKASWRRSSRFARAKPTPPGPSWF